jgi:hypothetical protein
MLQQIPYNLDRCRWTFIVPNCCWNLGQKLFNDLFVMVPEYKAKEAVVVVPDGKLHLLPFSALVDHDQFILTFARL